MLFHTSTTAFFSLLALALTHAHPLEKEALSVRDSSSWSWAETEHVFGFGDSYTTTGYNVSAGILSPDPGYTASDGKNWIQFLTDGTYNVNPSIHLFNLAYGGATIDSKLVTPYLPTVQSLKDQVDLFEQYFADKPAEANWDPEKTLFAVWVGINDVGNAWSWTNQTLSSFFEIEQTEYLSLLTRLNSFGAKNFLLLNVPPLDRTPLFIFQGSEAVSLVKTATQTFNKGLQSMASKLQKKIVGKEGWVGLFETEDVFDLVLDNSKVLGYTNATGYAEAYQNGTPLPTTQNTTLGLLPVSSYVWLNSLHPTWGVHTILAHAVSSFLAGKGEGLD